MLTEAEAEIRAQAVRDVLERGAIEIVTNSHTGFFDSTTVSMHSREWPLALNLEVSDSAR
jgi:hypothetical protein